MLDLPSRSLTEVPMSKIIDGLMRYEEFRPAEPLAKLVKCIWIMESEQQGSHTAERILPDGCTEMVFNLAEPFEQHRPDGSAERQPLTLLAGQMQQPLLIAPTGRVQLMGVRFWPGGAYSFLMVPQTEITGRVIALDAILGSLARELQSRIAEASSSAAAVKHVETALLARLKQSASRDEAVLSATGLILRSGGRLSIRRLAERIGINARTLDRRFNTVVGLTPKALCRIVRFQQVFKMIQPGGVHDWARLAADCGYYDQPHFIREFKAFAGREPTSYFAQPNGMSDHFTGNS